MLIHIPLRHNPLKLILNELLSGVPRTELPDLPSGEAPRTLPSTLVHATSATCTLDHIELSNLLVHQLLNLPDGLLDRTDLGINQGLRIAARISQAGSSALGLHLANDLLQLLCLFAHGLLHGSQPIEHVQAAENCYGGYGA